MATDPLDATHRRDVLTGGTIVTNQEGLTREEHIELHGDELTAPTAASTVNSEQPELTVKPIEDIKIPESINIPTEALVSVDPNEAKPPQGPDAGGQVQSQSNDMER